MSQIQIRHLLFLSFYILTFVSCAAPGKRFERLNEALALSPSTGPGRDALERQCQDGLSAACGFLGAAVEVEKPAAIVQGPTTSAQTRFAILNASPSSHVNYYLRSGNSVTKLTAERLQDVDHVEAFNLDPKNEYELLVVDGDARLLDRRTFRTLNTDRQRARILLVSGTDPGADPEGMKIWSEIAAQKPDVIFLLGNHVSGGEFSQHLKSRRQTPLYAAKVLTPVFAIWNDRDYGKSNGDRTFGGKLSALDAFQTFFPQKKPASQFETGPGNSFWWGAFGASFVFLDNRSFRSPDAVDLPDQTHLGVEQEAWVGAKIALGRPVVLISGDPFFAAGSEAASFESSHPKDFTGLLKAWSSVKTPLVFFSGNRGLNEVVEVPKERLGFKTFEVTSASLQGKPPQASSYAVFELMRSERNIMRFHVQSFGPGAKLLFQKTLMVKR